MKKGQFKPGVKFSKVNRVQSEDGAPQPNVGDAAGAGEEEQAPSEPPSEMSIPVQAIKPERNKYGLVDRRHVSGDTKAQNGTKLRSRTSMTIRCYQRPHQILVDHSSQSPNMKTAT